MLFYLNIDKFFRRDSNAYNRPRNNILGKVEFYRINIEYPIKYKYEFL